MNAITRLPSRKGRDEPTARLRLQCAVYTRKSTDEGLDQEFNSLDAQHEACAAYIASQVGLGWKLVSERYDDGGVSGGTMERPALQRLLQDIRERRVDVVVVYKIDRLTRSLTDFSKIVEVFDAAGASFVSVTQQFNTTTSMGRLTLNVLLSFAQFEREVTAERIRDKIAASKRKGMWMGGIVPLGYRVENRKLLVHDAEATTVRRLFERYLELGSVTALAQEALAEGWTTRVQRRRDGNDAVTSPFGRGNLYHLLSNPIYIGKIRHRDQLHDGEHEAVITQDIFDRVQARLSVQALRRKRSTNAEDTHLLTGLLYDGTGNRLHPVHASKGHRRYRYYVSKHQARQRSDGLSDRADQWRLPASELDTVAMHRLVEFIDDEAGLVRTVGDHIDPGNVGSAISAARRIGEALQHDPLDRRRSLLRQFTNHITVEPGCLTIVIDRAALASLLIGTTVEHDEGQEQHLSLTCPISLRRRGVETRIVIPGSNKHRQADPALIALLSRAHCYLHQLTKGAGRSLSDVAALNQVDLADVSRTLPLAFLSPRITDAIVTGSQPAELTAQSLSRLTDLPIIWSQQADRLGI